MKKLKNIPNLILNIIIFMLIVIAVFVMIGFVQLNILNREYTDIFGYSLFQTKTGSMIPTIEIGDIVIVKLGDDVKQDDIITYKEGNSLITHRITQIDSDKIITKGDNNNTEDKPISREDIVGKVVYIIGDVQIWKMVFSDISVIIPICITIALFIVLILYKENSKDKKDDIIGEKNE